MLLEDYRNERLKKLEELKARGIDPYPAKSHRNTKISDVIDHFDEKQYLAYYEEKRCSSSGNRLMLKVRYYFKQDPVTSRAYIVDWRAVCVEES